MFQYFRSTFILLFMFASCGSNNPPTSKTNTTLDVPPSTNSQLDVNPLSGYFVKNTIKVTDSLTFWVIDNKQIFDSLFGMGRTMNNTIVQPDFGTQIVIAATMPTSWYGTKIDLAGATLDDNTNDAAVRFITTSSPNKNSYSMTPLWLGTVPKMGKCTFSFYNGDKLGTRITTFQ